ncbi:PIR Superfamily Protein [Plasmodium ovale wallikeri]|uniref:PIR Superfamily Protein n=2 Tax=Plasmodium ovale TaxID=36330 RepID=A0A1A9AGX8_PLAOA|nr:PIR Superfamily Protein [Plasmodium ovale wallikeri]SBT56244.1 PIR Superfamily Protein [Plasmodium ovale wallikeri]SBT73065.1 PIR protein [Plasmodium ovale]
MQKTYDFSLNLPSRKLYENLYWGKYKADEYKKCDSLANSFRKYNDIDDFCMDIRGNLKNFHSLKIDSTFKDYTCQFLNIWIHYHLSAKKIEYSDVFTYINSYFLEFYDSTNQCTYNFYSVPEVDFEKLKTLFDYALDYSYINYYVNQYPCTKANEEYINKRRSIYEQFNRECISSNTKIYCNPLKSLISAHYKNDKLLDLKCKTVIDSSSSRDQGHLDGSSFQTGELGSEPLGQGRDSTFGNVHQTGLGVQSELAEATPPLVDSNIIMSLLFPLIGIVPLFILYKFTPFGSWINSFIPRKRKILSKIDSEMSDEFIEDALEHENIYPGERHHINYHPA